jgi:antitoxin component YwqK of YwqJK toxin-antitoxin module
MRKWIFLFILFQVFWFSYAQDTTNLNGFKVFYYPNGIKSSEGLLVDGKPEGWWKSYSEKGVLISEGNRKNFLLDSLWIFYNEKGSKTLEINYKEGKKFGQRIQYSENEYIVENWRNDTLYGMVIPIFRMGK